MEQGDPALLWCIPPPTDEAFHALLGRAMIGMLDAQRRRDTARCEGFLAALRGGLEFATNKRRMIAFYGCTAASLAFYANWLNCQHIFEQVPETVSTAWRVLNARDAVLSGRQPGKEARWNVLGALADYKWRQPDDAARDLLLTPEEAAAQWLACSAFLRSYADDRPDRRKLLVLVTGLLNAGLGTAAVALRYAPESLQAVAGEWNAWHARVFRGAALVGLADSPWEIRAASSHWYWQWQIIQEWFYLRLTRESCMRLYTGLLDSAGRDSLVRKDTVYFESIVRDQRWMDAEARRRERLNSIRVVEERVS